MSCLYLLGPNCTNWVVCIEGFLENVNVAICRRPSVCRLSLCSLSSVTVVHPTQAVVIFGNISTAFGTQAMHWRSRKILGRSSQGNPSVGGVKDNRGSQI